MQMGLDELRALCKKNDMSYTGKTIGQMALMLVDADVSPPDDDEDDE